MKFVKIYMCLLIATQARGQTVADIKNRLFEKNFPAFLNLIDSFLIDDSETDNRPTVYLKQLRDVMPGYQEVYVDVFNKSKCKDCIPFTDFYRIMAISFNKEIIFYQVLQQKSRIENGVRLDYFPVTDSLKNQKAFRQFRKDFFELYNASLREEELLQFYDYGLKWCNGEMEPPMRYQLNIIYKTNNLKLLNQWLASPNTELQIYAIEGLCEYKKRGYALTDWQKWVINIIKNKSGTINTCSGCLMGLKTSIQEALSRFDLDD